MEDIKCMSSMEALSNEELDEMILYAKSRGALHYVELCVPFYCSACGREEDFDVLVHFHGELCYNDFNYCD